MTTPVPAVGTVSAAAQTAAADAAHGQSTKSLLNPQAFLQLLVAQLQYQDPSNPVDTSSFMNQTAMLSQVQTMNTMSSTLTAIVSAQQTQAATSMIGKTISYVDATGAKATGLVTGATLGATGASVQVGTATVPLANVQQVTAT